MHVWMIDIDAQDLATALLLVQSHAVPVPAADTDTDTSEHQFITDIIANVANQEEMRSAAQRVYQHESTASVHFLMNNAAIQLGGNALKTSMDTFNQVLGVNTLGPIHGCQAFVPFMQEKGQPGIIVNTGSKQGITAPPGNLSYNVSKAALKTWTEGLEHELMVQRTDNNGKLYAALLIPGWVNTSIQLKEHQMRAALNGSEFEEDNVFFHEEKPAEGAWMPMQVIDYMMEGLEEGRFYIVCPDNDVDRETDNLRMTWAMVSLHLCFLQWRRSWKETNLC